MAASPERTTLYRRARRAVICALAALCLAPLAAWQLPRTTKKDKGPRAVGLVELSTDGNARFIPVAIMIDGKFYDAAAYKASPVPMAIWGGTVYEAERTGVAQGLFTVSEALKTGNNWSANGKWVPAGAKPVRKHVEAEPNFDEDSGPPKLRRPEGEKSAPTQSSASPPDTKTPTDAKTPSDSKSPSDAKNQPVPAPPTTPSSKPGDDQDAAQNPATANNTSSNDADPNRPVLVRGKIETLGSTQHSAPGSTGSKAVSSTGKATATPSTKDVASKPSDHKAGPQLLPAVSDAGGPDPRPYSYDLKADEEQKFRKKMLSMASDLIVDRAKPIESESAPAPAKNATRPGTSRRGPKPPQPAFDDVQFHAFDLWNTNEPVFILSAKAQMPKAPTSTSSVGSDLTYYITLVVKEDIYGDLRKLNATVTDTRHLDETPRMELIDAVDADGDGRGELLFREISDAGSVYGIYRAGTDQLFPLFEGER